MINYIKRYAPIWTLITIALIMSVMFGPVNAQTEPPKLFADDSQANKVTIQWNEIKGAQHYELWRFSKGSDRWILIEPALTDLTYVDAEVQAGTQYQYAVRAHGDNDPLGDWSDYKSITAYAVVGSLDAPELTVDGTQPRQVILRWTEVEGAVGYGLWRYMDGNDDWTNIPISPTDISHTDIDVQPGNTYYYSVRAQARSKPYGAWSDYKTDKNKVTVVGVDSSPPPISTSTVTATATVRIIMDSLSPTNTRTVVSGGGGSVTVSRPTAVRTATPTSTSTATTTPTPTVSPTPTNTPYPTSTSTPLPKPGSVKSLTATAVTATSIKISWSPPDKRPGPTSYIVQTTSNSAGGQSGGPVTSGSGIARNTSYTISGLQPCTGYGIRVLASCRLPNGQYSSGPETSISITTKSSGTLVPASPSGLSATPRDRRVFLRWDRHNGHGVSYQYAYKKSNEQTWGASKGTSNSFVTIGSLENGVAYSFRVRVNIACGSADYPSSYSTTTATPTQ